MKKEKQVKPSPTKSKKTTTLEESMGESSGFSFFSAHNALQHEVVECTAHISPHCLNRILKPHASPKGLCPRCVTWLEK